MSRSVLKAGWWIVALGLAAALMLIGYSAWGVNPARVILGGIPWENCEVPLTISSVDRNQNGTPDALDVVAGARQEVSRGTEYDAAYYQGYPPEGRGACTDVVWRAMAAAGLDLKAMVDKDIKERPADYGATGQRPDPNIDFRRVPNLTEFFAHHGQRLTTEVKPGKADNLVEWQPGDIVVFGAPYPHIGIISDKRRRDGVPLIIHNSGPKASEGDVLLRWPSPITHHFRFPTVQ